MNRTAITLATAVSLTLFTGPLAAQQTGADANQPGATTESLHKGETLKEAQSWSASEVIERYDVDGSGELNEGELAVFGAAAAAGESTRMEEKDRGEQMLKLLDEDGNGSVSQEELKQSDLVRGG